MGEGGEVKLKFTGGSEKASVIKLADGSIEQPKNEIEKACEEKFLEGQRKVGELQRAWKERKEAIEEGSDDEQVRKIERVTKDYTPFIREWFTLSKEFNKTEKTKELLIKLEVLVDQISEGVKKFSDWDNAEPKTQEHIAKEMDEMLIESGNMAGNLYDRIEALETLADRNEDLKKIQAILARKIYDLIDESNRINELLPDADSLLNADRKVFADIMLLRKKFEIASEECDKLEQQIKGIKTGNDQKKKYEEERDVREQILNKLIREELMKRFGYDFGKAGKSKVVTEEYIANIKGGEFEKSSDDWRDMAYTLAKEFIENKKSINEILKAGRSKDVQDKYRALAEQLISKKKNEELHEAVFESHLYRTIYPELIAHLKAMKWHEGKVVDNEVSRFYNNMQRDLIKKIRASFSDELKEEIASLLKKRLEVKSRAGMSKELEEKIKQAIHQFGHEKYEIVYESATKPEDKTNKKVTPKGRAASVSATSPTTTTTEPSGSEAAGAATEKKKKKDIASEEIKPEKEKTPEEIFKEFSAVQRVSLQNDIKVFYQGCIKDLNEGGYDVNDPSVKEAVEKQIKEDIAMELKRLKKEDKDRATTEYIFNLVLNDVK